MADIAVLGLAVMGANLARNFASRGHRVFLYNRSWERTQVLLDAHGQEGNFVPAKTLTELVAAMPTPRVLLLMVKAGPAVDELISELIPHLAPGDTLIDGGNSFYRDSERRVKTLAEHKMHFIGMGVSGGEEGALKGPSMMPGGSPEALKMHMPLLASAAAADGLGGTCIAPIGPSGSGHFVKMVHNGIEYGIMQLICEIYDALHRHGGLSNTEIANIFSEWNQQGILKSFLIEITATVLKKKDDVTGRDLVDLVKDAAGQKGTGKWTTDAALGYGVAVPTITAAVDARIISSDWAKRQTTAESAATPLSAFEKVTLVQYCKSALELATMCSYTQGFQLILQASTVENWNVNLAEVARVWRSGCIIRSEFLQKYQESFAKEANPISLLYKTVSKDHVSNCRKLIASAILAGIPLPSLSSSLSYLEAYRTARLPQNILQAQRDFFGAHTFERLDQPGTFHADWHTTL